MSSLESELVAMCRDQAAQLPGALPADEVQRIDQEVRSLVPMLLGAVSREVGFSVSSPQIVIGNPEEIVATYARYLLPVFLDEQPKQLQMEPSAVVRSLVSIARTEFARVVFDKTTPILVVN